YLPPGSQHVINVHFDFSPSTTGGAIVPITSPTIGGQKLTVNTIYGSYQPTYETMYAKVSTCCDVAGDADNSGSVNIGDATYLIQYIFSSGPAPVCADEGDADGSNSVNIGDVTHLIAYIFSSGPAPVCGSTGV
ncbi:MAG TPA: dockerin type I repeat-containing protein, partial [candidate division Zixibacteria bacterium]|nr:dockerin type I repeat-containing protein [candidate division Zixibacteria bacterium]